jgi:hypothetical protein
MVFPKLLNKAVADAFSVVSRSMHFRDKWIGAHDWARIISHEYDVPDEFVLDDSVMNQVCKDPRYKLASETVGNYTGTFRNEYNPQLLPDGAENTSKKNIFCYYVTVEGGYPPKPPPGDKWYDYVQSVVLPSDRHYCAVTDTKI